MVAHPPVAFAILSPARWGRNLLESVKESSKLRFAGVFSRSTDNAAEIAATYGGKAYDSYESILADPSIEAIVLPTPHFLHYPQGMAALNAGKHVFVEKPIANTLAEAREMQRLAEQKGLVLAVGMQGRRTGGIRKARAMIENDELGQIALAVAVHGAPIAQNYTDDDWETSAKYIPGGPLDNLGIHYADVMQYLLGPVHRVSGFYTKAITRFDVPDAAVASLEFANGTVGSYTTQQVSSYISQLSLYGTKGTIHIKRFGQELDWQEIVDTQASKQEGPTLTAISFNGPLPFTTALQEELEEFADCIRQGTKPEIGAAEGIAALKLIRAVMASSETGQTITLNEWEG